MLWHKLESLQQLQNIKEQSANGLTVLIFKHSTRCSISLMALNRLESKWVDDVKTPAYYLDLLSYREVSDEIVHDYEVEHASPQVLLIKDAVCIYNASHTTISVTDILEALKN